MGIFFYCRGWRGWRFRVGRDLFLFRVGIYKGIVSKVWGKEEGFGFIRVREI